MKTKLLTLTAVACLFVATASNAQVPSYVPTNGLVGWWPFNGNANDESGNNNNGTVNGATLTSDRFGNVNKAYSFDGINNEITTTISSVPTNPNELTQSCWILANFDLGYNVLITRRQVDHGPDWLTLNVVNGYAYAIQDCNYCASNSDTSGAYVANGTWHNIIGVKSYNNYSLYIDGILISNLDGICSFQGSSDFFSFGSHHAFANSIDPEPYKGWYSGKLDDIGIWNRALSQQEITALYNSSSCTKPEPVTLGTSATTERCPNDQVTIKVVTPAADSSLTYQWTRNGTNMAGATSRSITVADAAKYKVFVRSGPGVDCQRVSGLVETTAATPPTITATTPNGNAYCAGDSVLMSATGITPGYSYQWKRFGVPIAGATSANFYAKQTGNYRCEVTNLGGCINQSNLITIVNGTSCRIMQDQSSDVSVYPNPAKNSFTVSFNDIGNEIPVSIDLRNLQGQIVETRKLNGVSDVQFNISKLSPGMYMIRVMLEGGDVVEKSVVVE